MMPRAFFWILAFAGLSACAAAPFAPPVTRAPTFGAPLVIYADATAANALRDMGAAFQQVHPDAQLMWTFAQPDALRAKLRAGQPADLVISADPALLNAAKQAYADSTAEPIGRDPLVIVFTNANPAAFERIEDLNRADIRIAIARANTSLGTATRALLENFRHDATFGPDFPAQFNDMVRVQADDERGVLNALYDQRAEIGIVYASQANPDRQRLQLVKPDDGLNIFANYYAVASPFTRNATQAARFIEALRSSQAQTLWRDYGFESIP